MINRTSILITVFVAAALASRVEAAVTTTTYKLNGTSKGNANMACRIYSPGQTQNRVTPLPVVVNPGLPLASLSLGSDGKFALWLIDSKSPNVTKVPSTANGWTGYTGNWTRKEEKLQLALDPTSTTNLYKYYNAGATSAGTLLYFDRQSYLLTGTFSAKTGGTLKALSERVDLKISDYYKSPKGIQPKSKCSTSWHYSSTFASQ